MTICYKILNYLTVYIPCPRLSEPTSPLDCYGVNGCQRLNTLNPPCEAVPGSEGDSEGTFTRLKLSMYGLIVLSKGIIHVNIQSCRPVVMYDETPRVPCDTYSRQVSGLGQV